MAERLWQNQDVWCCKVQDRIGESECAEEIERADLLGEERKEEECAAHAQEALKHEDDSDAGGWKSEATKEFEWQLKVLMVLRRIVRCGQDERE